MININTMTKKEKLNKDSNKDLLLITISGEAIEDKKEGERQILNLSIAIDVSGSMGMPVKRIPNTGYEGIRLFGKPNKITSNELISFESKLSQAKKAAIGAIENMMDGDYISIISFDNRVSIDIPSTKLSGDNRKSVYQIIDQLTERGSTDLHAGWIAGAEEVAKELNPEYMNRVIILTDGQANSGITSSDQIATNVMAINNKGINTTTFGVGEEFNEDLLQDMANSGGGNFYYIEDSNQFQSMFSDEFGGLSNICGSDVKLEFKLKGGFEINENLNSFKLNKKHYMFPNIISTQKLNALFEIKCPVMKSGNNTIGEAILTYKDHNGKKQKLVVDMSANVVGKTAWKRLPENKEVHVHEALLMIAKKKDEATIALNSGDLLRAKTLLSDSITMVSKSGINDHRLESESNLMGATLSSADTMSIGGLRKDISYQSYKTRIGK
jgi:Ca-activated chloride channel family protein